MSATAAIRIVMAEDDFLVSKGVERALLSLGCKVVGKAADGREAVEMVKRHRPDLALLDIKMPKMDGLEAARHIQEMCPTPVVILTAHETKDLVKMASEIGVGGYLVKPPDPKELERAICIAIARHDDLMQLRKLSAALTVKNEELQQALSEIKILQGIIPICSFCKKVRDDKGYWQQVEKYISDRSEALFSHGLCPGCRDEHYGDLLKKKTTG